MAAAMWRLHRYYLRELAINAGITFLVLFAIVMVSLVARGIQRSQGGGPLDAAIITLFWALDAFPHLLPISFLLATVMTFSRAVQDREFVAIRSAGISPRVAMMAAVLIALPLAITGSVAMHYVLPEVHFRKYRIIAEVVRDLVSNMKLGTGNDRIPIPGSDGWMTFARKEGKVGDDDDLVYRDCWLYLPNGRQIDARIASPICHVEYVVIPKIKRGSTVLQIQLHDIFDPISGNGHINADLGYQISSIELNRRDERDDDMVSSQLLSEVLRGVHEMPTAAIYTLNRRTCFAVLPLLLAPLGFCIALFARDRGRALALVYSLLPLLVFYVGDVLGAKLLRATDNPLAGWLPAGMLLVLGAPFCWRELRR